MYDKKHFLIVLIVTLVGLMIPGSLFASETGTVRATSSFEGHGLAFALEDERVYMVGAWGGVMTIRRSEGSVRCHSLGLSRNSPGQYQNGHEVRGGALYYYRSRWGQGLCEVELYRRKNDV